jgi:hypothetical protein
VKNSIKNIILMMIIFVFAGTSLFAQNKGFFAQIGGSGTEMGALLAEDNQHNIITTGSFTSDLYVYDSALKLNNSRLKAYYLIKFAEDGSLIWQKAMESTKHIYLKGITTDSNCNIYVCGYYVNDLYYDTAYLKSSSKKTVLGANAFIMSFDKNGAVNWYKNFVCLGNAIFNEVKVIDNSIYFSLLYNDSMYFGGNLHTSLPKSSENQYDCIIGKMTLAGDIIWNKELNSDFSSSIQKLTNEPTSGDIYFAGFLGNKKFYFDGTSYSLPDTTGQMILVKLTSDGSLVWMKFGKTNGYGTQSDIKIDAQQNIYIGGSFNLYLSYSNLNLKAKGTGDQWGNDYDVFILKLDSSGSLIWGKSFGNANNSDIISGCGLMGNTLFISGYYQTSLTIDTFNLKSKGTDTYIAALDTAGNINKIINIAAEHFYSQTQTYDIIVGTNSQVYITGYFNDNIKFGSYSPVFRNLTDAFVWCIDKSLISSTNDYIVINKDLHIYPNPVRNSLRLQTQNITTDSYVSIFDLEGKLLRTQFLQTDTNIDVSLLQSGMYLMQISNENNVYYAKFIKE